MSAFLPKTFHAIPEESFEDGLRQLWETVTPWLKEGTFFTHDGLSLAYEAVLTPDPAASVVIVHGFTEFYRKYDEMVGYFVKAGYRVFVYDQRGHGLSERQVADPELTHVERFSDYAEDLHTFMEQVVRPNTPEGVPIRLFAHSMGGGVALLYLAGHPEAVQKAVLSAPMVCPRTHSIPRRLLKHLAWQYAGEMGWNAQFPHSNRFERTPNFHLSSDGSYARFLHNFNWRLQQPLYRNSASTNRWMYECSVLQDTLLAPETTRAVTTPILMLCGDNDRVVRSGPQKVLARRLSRCRRIILPGARHALFTGVEEHLNRFYRMLFAFFEKEDR